MVKLDLDRTTGLVSLGTHTFKVDRIREEVGPSGHPYLGLSCVCTDEGPDRGKEAFLVLSLSPQARFKLDEFLDAIKAPKTGTMDSDSFKGKFFRAEVVHEEYEGNVRVGFRKMIPYDGQLGMELGQASEDLEAEENSEEAPERPRSRDPFA